MTDYGNHLRTNCSLIAKNEAIPHYKCPYAHLLNCKLTNTEQNTKYFLNLNSNPIP